MKKTVFFVLLIHFCFIGCHNTMAQTRVFIGGTSLLGNVSRLQPKLEFETKLGLTHGFVLGASFGDFEYAISETRQSLLGIKYKQNNVASVPVSYLMGTAGYNLFMSPRFYFRCFTNLKYKLGLNFRKINYEPAYLDKFEKSVRVFNMDTGILFNYYLTNGIVVGIGALYPNILDNAPSLQDLTKDNYFVDPANSTQVLDYEFTKSSPFYILLNVQIKIAQIKTKSI